MSLITDSEFSWSGLPTVDSPRGKIRRLVPACAGRRISALHRVVQMLKVTAFVLAVTSSNPYVVQAQRAELNFTHLTTDHGLSHNSVIAVIQDQRGFMWFGTQDGLNRFDGQNFRHYRNIQGDSTSLSDSFIISLIEDSDGVIWIGTRYGGLNRFDAETETFHRYPFGGPDEETSLGSGIVKALFDWGERGLWVGTMGGGLSVLDRETGHFTHFRYDSLDTSTLSEDKIWNIYVDRSETLWVGTWDGGLNEFIPSSNSFRRHIWSVDGKLLFGSNRIRSILEDQEGLYWIGTSGGGLSRWNRETQKVTVFKNITGNVNSISDNKVWDVHQDSRGILWIGTFGGGVGRLDPSTNRFTRYLHDPAVAQSLSNNVVNDVYEDRAGILWLATDRGVSRVNLESDRFIRYRRQSTPSDGGLSEDDVLALYPSMAVPGNIWVGTLAGVELVETSTGQASVFAHGEPGHRLTDHEAVSAMAEDERGRLWIGTRGGGLERVDLDGSAHVVFTSRAGDRTSLSSDAVRAILVDRNGIVWIGTDGGGLNRFESQTETFVHYRNISGDVNNLSDFVSTLFEDSHGLIWIGTFDSGLNRLNPVSGRISRIAYSENEPSGSEQIPASERVVSIIEDEDGFLWIGTYSGLRKYEPTTGRSWRFGSVDGLPSDAVLGVTDGHDGTLWISTSQAVSRFDIETSTFTNYTAESGLPLLQFNPGAISSTASGTILIGGNDGFITFDPEDLVSNRSVPQIVITEIRRGNDVIATDVWSGEKLHLSYRDGIIGLKFALLDYANPSTHEFQYILEGFEQSWHDVQGPVGEATITNTTGRSGTFRFRVRGVGRSGMSNELILSVIIRAPWWRTPLFAIFITIIVVITATAVIVIRIRKRRYERVETQRMLSESRERERLHLTRELHDSPLQNLYSARHKLELIALVDGASENNDIINETQKILQQTAEDLRRICGELRPPTLEDFGLEQTIRSHLREFGSEHPNLELEADLLPDELRLPEDRRHRAAT